MSQDERAEQVKTIITGCLRHLERFVTHYKGVRKVYNSVSIGANGMEPEFMVEFSWGKFAPRTPFVEISVWDDKDVNKYHMTFMRPVDSDYSDITVENHTLDSMDDAWQFFQRTLDIFEKASKDDLDAK